MSFAEAVSVFAEAALAAGFVLLAASVLVSTAIEAWRGPKR